MVAILEPAQSKLIFYISFLAIGTYIYAIYKEHIFNITVPCYCIF